MPSHADTIATKHIENGVLVPPGLQVNEMTLAEHQDYLTWLVLKPRLTRAEAIAVGHRPSEVYAYFGPLPVEAEKSVAVDMMERYIARSGFDRIVSRAEEKPTGLSRTVARTMGFTGDVCVGCGGVRMQQNGTCVMCADCGQTTGCS